MDQLQLFQTIYMEYPKFRKVLKLVCYRRIAKRVIPFQASNISLFSGEFKGAFKKSRFYSIRRFFKSIVKSIASAGG